MYSSIIAKELNIKESGISATLALLNEGGTVPFIARYRKETTGGLDEVVITKIRDRARQLEELDERRSTVLKSIKEQGKLTSDLEVKIVAAEYLSILEDLYLPFKPKRRTKATVAKEKGLEPLAEIIFRQKGCDPKKEAAAYLNKELKVLTIDEALQGARDIIAEWISEDGAVRASLRELYAKQGTINSKVVRGKEEEGENYKDYFQWSQPVREAPSHRVLAVRRAEKEGFLTFKIEVPSEAALEIIKNICVKGEGDDSQQVLLAAEDSFKRLLDPSMQTETRLELKQKADSKAIMIFAENLRQLLMAPPLGAKNIMAIDPGIRTGSKVVCLDVSGKLLGHEAVFLFAEEKKKTQARQTLVNLKTKHGTEIIAIGNGTGSRETEQFVRSINELAEVPVVVVSESGASIYSASPVAREEFPDHDVTVRGAVSIGRRLMDPLAELVKIDPKSIGVGQYQHDVDQAWLKHSLDDVVISCVNQVGVEVNTASKELLKYVAGLGVVRARALVDFRQENGAIASRHELEKVAGIKGKVFEQAAGFLRIIGAANPLDASAVHPESYGIVERMAADLKCTIKELMTDKKLQQKIDINRYVSAEIGLPTLNDILNELAKPGRDPRAPFVLFEFKEGIERIEDLSPGMKLPGVVTNITAFGAFVDVGVHHDGLVHISRMSTKFVRDPNQIVKIHQKVQVEVVEVDLPRKRIALSLISPAIK